MLVVIVWWKGIVISKNHFIPTANAAVDPRPHDAFARTEELVELVVRARGKVGRVPVFSHGKGGIWRARVSAPKTGANLGHIFLRT